MPVFNKEHYVEEAIKSVLNQSYNKESEIDLILVNDGSTDKSCRILDKFARMYPEQITYVDTLNRGPAAARNYGFSFVSDHVDVVGYVDADDIIGKNAVSEIHRFLLGNNVNIATIPVRYFNSKGMGGDHSLNYRFLKGSKVVNVYQNYDAIHFYAGGVFIKREILSKNNSFFDESMQYWEDALSINRHFLHHPTYGVVSNAYYYYRRDDEKNNSVVDEYWDMKERYTCLVNKGYKSLIKKSISLHGKVLPFIQYLIVFHMKLYLFDHNYKKMIAILTSKEQEEFIRAIQDVLTYIEPYYISSQKMKWHYKSFLISLKETGWPPIVKLEKGDVSQEEVIIKSKKLTLSGIEIVGRLSEEHYLLQPDNLIYVASGSRKIVCEILVEGQDISIWGVPLKKKEGIEFKVIVPYHLLNFRYYLWTKKELVSLNRFNYYKRIVKKLLKRP